MKEDMDDTEKALAADQNFLAELEMDFDRRPGAITASLSLRKPKYQETAAHCHNAFSAENLSHKMASNFFVWENCKDLTKYKVMNPAGDATVLTNFFTPESCSDHRSHKPHCCNHAGF